MWGIELIVILAMIGLNSLFAGYEIALASVSIARLKVLVRENRRGARAALLMKENMEASLAVVQLGITLVGAIAAATGGAGAEAILAPLLSDRLGLSAGTAKILAIALIVLLFTYFTIMFGELLPKVFALRNKEWFCLKLSPIMRGFTFLVKPAVWLLEGGVTAMINWAEHRWQPRLDGDSHPAESATLKELRAITAMARDLRLIGHQEEGIILGATELSNRSIQEIMLPAEFISTLHINDSLADSLIKAHMDMHTRFPVTERSGNPQSIIGYVNFKDIVAIMRLTINESSVKGILRPIPSMPATMPITNCLEVLMRGHTHIALVKNALGRVLGMISLEDILEEIVGDIQDEYDRLPSHLIASGSGWVVGGGMPLGKLHELTGISLSNDEAIAKTQKLTDWVITHLGRSVQGGDVIEETNLRVIVRKVRRQKVQEAQITQR